MGARWPEIAVAVIRQSDVMVESTVSIEVVQHLRSRILPMFQYVQTEYRDRVPSGYPNVVDTADRGVVGIELDPSHSLYIVTDCDRRSPSRRTACHVTMRVRARVARSSVAPRLVIVAPLMRVSPIKGCAISSLN